MPQPNRSVLLSAKEVSLNFGDRLLLDKVSFDLKQGDSVGLVGKNGSGKTSLLKLVARLDHPDQGEMEFKSNIKINYLSQEFELDPNQTVFETIAQGWFRDLGSEDEVYVADILEREQPWRSLNPQIHAFVFEQIGAIIRRLDCRAGSKLISELSGGEKRKVALAQQLINAPDLLILDEPTNHLDIAAIEKLEQTLAGFSGCVMIVSHDRYFLDRVCSRMLELSQAKLYQHFGNYQDYLQAKAIRQEIEGVQEDRRQAFLKRELNWVNAGVKARGTKDKGRLKRYYEEKTNSGKLQEEEMNMILPEALPLGNKILIFENAGLRFGDRIIVKHLDYNVQPGTVLGLIGPNGIGKTSLIKAILGQIELSEGRLIRGLNTIFNYQDQDKQQLDPYKTAWEEISEGRETIPFGNGTINARKYLQNLLFDRHKMNQPIKNLSGGERSRLLLGKILKEPGNVLILDEPTNDLDLETIRVLEESIIGYDGVVIVASHDRYFLNRVCTHILALEGNGAYTLSTGNYDSYRVKAIEYDLKTPSSTVRTESKPNAKQQRQQEKWIRDLEKKIGDLEAKINSIEADFQDAQAYAKDPNSYDKKFRKHQDLQQELELLLQDWEEASSS